MVNIIILGGGFAGIRAALALRNKVESYGLRVIVIDKGTSHVFTPSLYEVATAEESPKNVLIPYKYIFKKPLEFIKGNITEVDVKEKKILLDDNREYAYNYLIFALGSEPVDFDIPGIKEYGVPLKTLEDSVRIKNALRTSRKIIIGGGGFSGTELACELVMHKGHLSITLIQGSPILLKELGGGVSVLAKKKLEKGNVHLVLGKHIKKVTKEIVEIDNGEIFPYDLFIWTGGVRSNGLLGGIEVDENLAVKNLENVFAIGDCVSPGVAPRAERMGEIAAENLLRSIEGKTFLAYSYHDMGYVIPLGGHFVTFAMGRFHISGIFAYILQQLIYLRYLLTIVPFFYALKKFIRFERQRSI